MSIKTILFVEDDPVALAMYQESLENEGFHLECAQDGLAAFKILSNLVPDLVLLDLMLPRFNGIHVLKYMQADPRLSTVPVIILSNATMAEIVPPDSPLSPVVQGTRRLLKGDCTFPTLLGTIRESLSAPPRAMQPIAMPIAVAASDNTEVPEVQVPPPVPNGLPPAANGNGANVVARGFDTKSFDSSLKAVLKEKEARCAQLEKELATLRKTRDDIDNKLQAELKTSAKYQQETKEVQKRMREAGAELEIIKAGLKHQSSEWARLESELRDELDSTKQIAGQAETVLKEKETRCSRLEEELAGARKLYEQLQNKSTAEQQVSTTKTQQQIKQLQAELERATADLAQQSAERKRLESEWHEQLHAAKTAGGQAERIFKEKEAWCNDLEKELANLQKARDDFQNKFAAAQQTIEKSQKDIKDLESRLAQTASELERAKAGSQQQSAERTRLETELREQLNTARATGGKTEAALKEREAWCRELETEVEGLQKSVEGLQSRLTSTQQVAEKSQRDNKDLESRLTQTASELERAKAGVQQQSSERNRLETELREQLTVAKEMAGKAETALKDKETWCGDLEKELANLQKSRDELLNKFMSLEQVAEKAQKDAKDFEGRLSQATTELDRARAGVQQQSAERTRLESDLREQLTAAKETAERAETELKEKEAWCAALERELGGLRRTREELQGKVTAAQQSSEKARQELRELQDKFSQSSAELGRAKAGVEQQSAERTRLESDLREQLAATKAAAAKTETALKEKEAWCAEVEKELASVQKSRNELQNTLTTGQQASAKLQQELKELQQRTAQAGSELEQSKVSLTQQLAERTRSEAELREQLNVAKATGGEKVQQEVKDLQDRLQKARQELQRTKASLDEQLGERLRLENENKNLAETKRTLSEGLSRMRSTQIARESEVTERQKKLVEALREGAVFFQARLREAESLKNPGAAKLDNQPGPAEVPAPTGDTTVKVPVKT